MNMSIKELKQINDRVNQIINLDRIIIEKISEIDNEIIKGLFSNIYNTIVDNIEINKQSLYSIYDYQDCENGKELIFNNIKLIYDFGLIEFVNFDDLDMSFIIINDKINKLIIDRLNIENDIDLNPYFDYDLEFFMNDIVNNNTDYDVCYFNQVFGFYMTFNNVIDSVKTNYQIK